jgi:hypothetical protein
MSRSLLLLVVPLLSFVPRTSTAQSDAVPLPRTSAAPSDAAPLPTHVGEAEREQARHLYDEAIQSGKRGDYRKAKASLVAAWSLIKTWEIAVNLGSAEMRLGQYRAAAEHLAWGIRDCAAKEGETYPPLVKAKALLNEAAGHVGQVKLLADEPGASIFVDDEVVGRSPLSDPLYLEPGDHVITARPANPERASLRLEVHVQPGDALESYLRFASAGVTKTADPEEPALPVSGESNKLEARTVVPLTLGGLAVIAGGVGLAFSIKASAAEDAAADWALRTGGNCDVPNAACAGLADARERRNDANRIANVAWISAGAFGVSALVTALFWPKATSSVAKANLRIGPRAMDDLRGVTVMGTFE